MSSPSGPVVALEDVKKQIELYIDCWRNIEKKFVNGTEEHIQQNFFGNISTECEQKFLIISKYKMHGLSYDAFRKLPIFLIDTQRIQVNHDHYYYWAFAADVYECLKVEISHVYDDDISGRFRLLMDILFLQSHNPSYSNQKDRLERSTRIMIL